MKIKTMQPVIGITMSLDKSDLIRKGIEYSFIRREYGQQVSAAGGQPIFLDCSIDPAVAVRLCDGIIIGGGEDIDPMFYAKTHHPKTNTEPSERTLWERRLINLCDEQGIRILGVCYGEQLLNVHYGGTLYQDLHDEFSSQANHGTPTSIVMQKVTFEQEFLGFTSGDSVDTAHRHHQAIRTLAPGFEVVARAKDGVIEAIVGRGHFGIQWHAESDGTAAQIYGQYIALCKPEINVRAARASTSVS